MSENKIAPETELKEPVCRADTLINSLLEGSYSARVGLKHYLNRLADRVERAELENSTLREQIANLKKKP